MESPSLTPYEACQVDRIARWKGRSTGLLVRLTEALSWPLDRYMAKALPGDRAVKMFEALNDKASWRVGHDLIRHEAGVQELEELRHGSLERCDRLSERVEARTAAIVTSESLLGGAGGILTEIASIPAEILTALRAIHLIGGCYGYQLDAPGARTLVLAIVGLSQVHDPAERQIWCEKVRSLEGREVAEVERGTLETELEADYRHEVEDEVVEGVGTTLLELKLGESIPFLGSAVGLVLDNEMVRSIEETARFVFQERWLRDNGKVDRIAPSGDFRPMRRRLSTGLQQAVYSSSYAISYGVVFPAALVVEAGNRVLPEPATRGFRDGTGAAIRSADRLLAARNTPGRSASSTPPTGLEPAAG